MGNNTKSEQDNLCISIINPRLCKKVSIKVAIEQHDMKWLFRYGQINNKIQYDKNGFPVMPDYAML